MQSARAAEDQKQVDLAVEALQLGLAVVYVPVLTSERRLHPTLRGAKIAASSSASLFELHLMVPSLQPHLLLKGQAEDLQSRALQGIKKPAPARVRTSAELRVTAVRGCLAKQQFRSAARSTARYAG